MKIQHVIIGIILFFLTGVAQASPQSLTYQGRILKSDGTPLEYSSVSFIFQITDSTGQCVIYQEQINGINMENSSGVFDVSIGQGTVTYPTSGSFSILDAFNNSGSFTCQGGVPYTASVTDARKLRVQFHDGVGWKLISPDSTIRSVPFAGYAVSAQKLGNNSATDFVLKTGIPTCANGTFLSWDGNQLSCQAISGSSGGTVTNVTSANSYITITNGTSTPQIALNVGTTANTVASGNDARLVNAIQVGAAANGDLGGTYPGPTVIGLQGVPVSAAIPSMGQFFKFNGTNWQSSAIAISDVTNLSTQLSNKIDASQMPANCAAGQTLTFSSPTGTWSCTSIAVTASNFGSQSQATFLAAPTGAAGTPTFRTIASTDLPVTGTNGLYINGGNSFGAAATLGTNDANTLGFKTNGSTRMTVDASGNVGIGTSSPGQKLSVAGTIESTSGGIKFPDGTTQTTASNSGGTVTSVSGTAPISIATGTTTPVISIQKSDATHDGYLSQADWSTFSSKLGTALSSAKIWVGNGSGAAAEVSVSGDASLANSGALTIANNAITTAKMFANPGINRLIATDGTTGANLSAFTCAVNETLTWSVATGWQCTAQSSLSVGTATNFSGNLAGDVTGTQSANVVEKIQGRTVASTAPSDGQVLQWSSSSSQWQPATSAGGSSSTTWITKTANYTAVAGDHILADTNGGAFTITLPASPSTGDSITIVDAAYTFHTSTLSVDSGSNKIQSQTGVPAVLASSGTSLTLTWSGNAAYGWVPTMYGVAPVILALDSWNVNDKNPSITLTNNGRTAQTSAGWAMARALNSKNSGKYYFELKVDQLSGNGNALMIGLADANASLTSAGSSGNEVAQASGGWAYSGLAGSWSGSNPQWQVGDIIGVAVDFSGNTMKIYRNNVNTSTFSATSLGFVLYPAIWIYDTGAKATVNLLSNQQTYSPPAGYVSWN